MGRCQKPVQDTGRGKQLSIHSSYQYNQDLNDDYVISFAFFLTKYVLLQIGFVAVLEEPLKPVGLEVRYSPMRMHLGVLKTSGSTLGGGASVLRFMVLIMWNTGTKKADKIGNVVFFITGHAHHEACSAYSCDEDLATWAFRGNNNINTKISNKTLL